MSSNIIIPNYRSQFLKSYDRNSLEAPEMYCKKTILWHRLWFSGIRFLIFEIICCSLWTLNFSYFQKDVALKYGCTFLYRDLTFRFACCKIWSILRKKYMNIKWVIMMKYLMKYWKHLISITFLKLGNWKKNNDQFI